MDEAVRLTASGYRCISNRHRMVSRLDRADWRDHMAREHTRGFKGDPDGNLEQGMKWVAALGGGAADHYRRILSKDTIEQLPKDVYDRIKRDDAQTGPDEYMDVIAREDALG